MVPGRQRVAGVVFAFALCIATSLSAKPDILKLSTDDEDDMDREFGDGDELTILFISDPPSFSGVGSGFILQNAVAGQILRPQIDAILDFTAPLGSDYRGTWTALVPGIVDELKIKIYNSSGADFATLNSHEFNVSCVPNQVQLIAGGDPCPDTPRAPTSSDWGFGRPMITNVTSRTSAPALLLAAGDTVTIGFEQPIDVDRLEAYRADNGLSGRAYVDTLFRVSPAGALGANYTGTWLNAFVFQLTVVEPPAAYGSMVTGNGDYSIACQPGAPIYLSLPNGSYPAESKECCDADEDPACEATVAAGSFGELPNGPEMVVATADDPLDAGAINTLSVGDTIRIAFNANTSMPSSADPSAMFRFFLDGSASPVDLGAWSATWEAAAVLRLQLQALPAGGAPSGDLSTLQVECALASNITTPPLQSGAPTSLPCGGGSVAAARIPVGGDFGAPTPTITVAMADDPDDGDAIVSAGDVISITFAQDTDRAGAALHTNISRAQVDYLFSFTPAVPAEVDLTATWVSNTTLNISIVALNGATVATTSAWSVSCNCHAPFDGGNSCRDNSGIRYAERHYGVDGELSCNDGNVSFLPFPLSNFGLHPGPDIVSVTAADPDDNDAVFSNGDTLTLRFDSATDLAGLSLNVAVPMADVDDLFTISPMLGSDYTGRWTANDTFVIELVDTSNHAVPGITYATSIAINCDTSGALQIRDAAQRFLPASCTSPSPIQGSFGNLSAPALAVALADDPDNLDAVLSAGDTIAVTWAKPTDRGHGGSFSICSGGAIAEPQPSLDQLLYFRLPGTPPTQLDLELSGQWTDCSTLTVTVGATPNVGGEPVWLTDQVEAVITGSGGTTGYGVRNSNALSTSSVGSLVVAGSFGEAPGPALVSMVAADPDDGDAVIGYGDTLTLTFDAPTDRAGFAINSPLSSSWIDSMLVGPPAPANAWSGVWTDNVTLVLTYSNASSGASLDAAAWGAMTDFALNRTLTTIAGVSSAGQIRDEARYSLPTSQNVIVTGNWGVRPGPGIASLVAGGGAGDAVYSTADTIKINFNTSTDRGGAAIGQTLSAVELGDMIECTLGAPAAFPTLASYPPSPPAPFPLASFGNITAAWESDDVFTMTVGSTSGADDVLLTTQYAGSVDGAAIGRLQCCTKATGVVVARVGSSLPSSVCSPPLSGTWGGLAGPAPVNISITDPTSGSADLDVGDVITITFDEPTDRGGMPIGWVVPNEVIQAGVLFSPYIFSAAQGEWVSDSVFSITILELHPNAPQAASALCSTDDSTKLRALIKPALGVRNVGRTSLAAQGEVRLEPEACAPGSGPGLYASGSNANQLLGMLDSELLPSGAATCPVSSVANVLRPLSATAGVAFSHIAAADEFTVAIASADGSVYAWGDAPLSSTPTALTLPGGGSAIDVSAGYDHCLILLSDGRVLGMGSDAHGQLGGTVASLGSPQVLSTLPAASAVAAGAHHSLVVANDTSVVYVFGLNDGGQLGGSLGATQTTPVALSSWLPSDARVLGVAGGRYHSLAIVDGMGICSWGSNINGQLGPVTDGASSTVAVSTVGAAFGTAPCWNVTGEFDLILAVTAVAAGDEHSVAIAGDGRVFTWGKSTGATGSASTGANRADLATTKLPLEGSGGPGAGSYTLTVTAGKQQTLATTAKGEVWVWGDNADGQLGTGCASLGQVLTPTLAEGVPAASISSWRLVPLSKPASLQTLSLVGQPYAGILGTVIDAQDPSLVPVAGGAAACRTACETHSTNLGGAAGSCVAFTFNRTTTDTSIQPGPLSCVFYQSAVASNAPFAVISDALNDLHIHEVRARGGVAAAASGSSHSVVAVGLTQTARCPVSGEAEQPCGGSSRGTCVLGTCVCEPGWSGDGCTKQACEPACHPDRGQCVSSASGATSCQCLSGWGGADCTELNCPTYGGASCASHGTCVISPADGSRVCQCEPGWGGSACELPLCIDAPLNGCSNHGSCHCAPTSQIVTTQAACGGDASQQQQCSCSNGYTGVDCSQTCEADQNGDVCGPRGTCGTTSSGSVTCMCDEGWTGALCEVPACPGTPECGGSARGDCVRAVTTASCTCHEGFDGDACETLVCPNGCSGYGACGLSSSGMPECACVFGYAGEDCSINEAMGTVIWAASIGGGLLALGLMFGLFAYCVRASRAGRVVGPVEAYRQRQWALASTGRSTDIIAVHTPKRLPTTASRAWADASRGGGVRTRVNPVA